MVLHADVERTGWGIPLVSSAVTVHFLCGAILVANSSLVYDRFGIAKVTFTEALLLAIGVLGRANRRARIRLRRRRCRRSDGLVY